jgi:hypothetical protein
MINARYTEHTRELVGKKQAIDSLKMLGKIAKVQAQRVAKMER